MVPIASPSRRVGIAMLVVVLFVAVAQPSVNDLPGFSDHTGPTEMEVTEFERLEAGCADEIATGSRRSSGGSVYTRTQFIGTPSADADLSVWVERTSSEGADLSDAHGTRVLWYEDGDLAGCSSSVTSPLDSECPRFSGLQLDRTWANASAEESGAT